MISRWIRAGAGASVACLALAIAPSAEAGSPNVEAVVPRYMPQSTSQDLSMRLAQLEAWVDRVAGTVPSTFPLKSDRGNFLNNEVLADQPVIVTDCGYLASPAHSDLSKIGARQRSGGRICEQRRDITRREPACKIGRRVRESTKQLDRPVCFEILSEQQHRHGRSRVLYRERHQLLNLAGTGDGITVNGRQEECVSDS